MAGGSKEAVSAQFGVTSSSVHRHRSNCLRLRPKAQKKAQDPEVWPPESRSHALSTNHDLDPKALLKRAEWLLDDAQAILTRASAGSDDRLALSAVREVRSSLELVMKAHGMLTPDNAVSVNLVIDQRRQAQALLAKLDIEELRALARGASIGSESGTMLADQTALNSARAVGGIESEAF